MVALRQQQTAEEFPLNLIVITPQRWRAIELAQTEMENVKVFHSYGFDIPEILHTESLNEVNLWAPQEYVTRIGLSLPKITTQLTAPPSNWLPKLDEKYTRRKIWVGHFEEVRPYAKDGMWWKPATIKHEKFPAQQHTLLSIDEFVKQNPDVIKNMTVQLSEDTPWRYEIRCFVRDGAVTTAAGYKAGETIYGSENFYAPKTITQKAKQWLQAQLDNGDIPTPSALVIDVGITPEQECSIVESNPVWCSAWYDNSINEVVQAIITSQKNTTLEWRWEPDLWLVRKTQKMVPLHTNGHTQLI